MSHREDELHEHETRPVERVEERRVEERPAGYVPPADRATTGDPAYERREPAPASGGQVNVQAGGTAVTAEPGPLYYVRRVVSLLFGILAVLLVLRIVLLLLAAQAGNAIVDFIYGISEPFVAPFRGIFAIDEVSPTGTSVLDVAALVAMVGWMLIYLLIIAILSLGDRTRRA